MSGLQITGLSRLYPAGIDGAVAGIHPVSFDLAEGTFFTLLGPSGCGKTTTLRCIAGLEQPDRGVLRLGERVFFDSVNGVNVPLNQRNIGMVFQSYAIWPHMTIFENVAFPLRAARGQSYSAADITRLVNEALDRVDLSGFGSRSPTQLSGGQQQRVALARAIVRHPKLLLLDEPLSNLDAKLRDEMRAELKRLQKEIGITTVYVTHDQSEALEMSDIIAILERGHLRQLGSPRQIYFEPKDAFVAKFMGSPNLLSGKIKSRAPGPGLGEVNIADGRTLVCRFSQSSLESSGTSISIRPEVIDLLPAGHPPKEGHNSLPGRLLSVGFLGHYCRCVIQAGAVVLTASVPSAIAMEIGSDVAVSFPFTETLALPNAS